MAGGNGQFLPERQSRHQENLAAETKIVRKIGICKNVPRVCSNLRQKNPQISRLLSHPQSSRRTTFLSAKEHFASVIKRQVRNGRSRKTGARSWTLTRVNLSGIMFRLRRRYGISCRGEGRLPEPWRRNYRGSYQPARQRRARGILHAPHPLQRFTCYGSHNQRQERWPAQDHQEVRRRRAFQAFGKRLFRARGRLEGALQGSLRENAHGFHLPGGGGAQEPGLPQL